MENVPYSLSHPHDHIVRFFLKDPELMASLLTHYPQKDTDRKVISLLDLKHLQYKSPVSISKNLVEGIGDLRFATTFKGSCRQSNVFFIFEHQSKKDQRMRLRGLNYIVQAYDQFENEHKGKEKLPYPVVVVLYHGKTPWNIPEMDEIIDLVPGAETVLLKYPLILIALSVNLPGVVVGHPALRALLEALQLASEGELAANFDRITDYFVNIKDDERVDGWFRAVVRYAQAVDYIDDLLMEKVLSKIFSKRKAQSMKKTSAQILFTEGKKKGKKEGIIQGEIRFGSKMVLKALQTKFGKVPNEIKQSIRTITDPGKLLSLVADVCHSETIDEFAATLK